MPQPYILFLRPKPPESKLTWPFHSQIKSIQPHLSPFMPPTTLIQATIILCLASCGHLLTDLSTCLPAQKRVSSQQPELYFKYIDQMPWLKLFPPYLCITVKNPKSFPWPTRPHGSGLWGHLSPHFLLLSCACSSPATLAIFLLFRCLDILNSFLPQGF